MNDVMNLDTRSFVG